MKKIIWPIIFLLSGLLGRGSLAYAASDGDSAATSVQQLISQLGDDQYVLRQRAEMQLLERGAEAFAELQAAGNHADLEISTRAKYLLTQINIDWVLPSDPPIVRSIMARFGELSLQEKQVKIIKLSELDNSRGFNALHRITKYESSGLVTRFAMYHLANAQTKQGSLKEAENLSQQALQIEVPEVINRNLMADVLTELGRHDWAEREWESVIETEKATEYQSLMARQSLALHRLHDRLEHKAAAELLTKTIGAINADPQIKLAYQENKRMTATLDRFRSNREFLLACHEESQGNFDRQRQHLELANQLEKGNADILIAMFHLAERNPGVADIYRKKVRKRLSAAKRKLEKEIESVDQPSEKRLKNPAFRAALAQRHNHWAWLVSNTVGDFKKAVQHSKKSLELTPGSPSYLDTLGRCYYAAGELENAIKVQREAIAKHPHLQVMHRQLKQFEDELQKRREVPIAE